MGSAFSFLLPDGGACASVPANPGLGDLPESCVASVLVHLDPQQICQLAMLNRAFRGASSADFVWESKLPTNYESLIQRVFEDKKFPVNLCKRDIYARLCVPNSIDGGTKKVWLDKSTGKICLSMASNGLAITGIDDRRYWSRIPTEESRFGSVAYLQQIWWFEVNGEVAFPFPVGSYSVYFRLHLGRAARRFCRRVCSSEHVHGWDIKPVRFQLSTSDGQQATTQCYLNEPGKWIYHHSGDFIVTDSSSPMKLSFSMTQIDCTHTKGGLCVDSVLVRPMKPKRG
nr:F-box protein PP2-A12-like [Ipomoea batatas]